MYAFLNKKTIISLVALAFASTSVSILAQNTSLDTSYLEEGLEVPHIIRLMNNTHPLSHDLMARSTLFTIQKIRITRLILSMGST